MTKHIGKHQDIPKRCQDKGHNKFVSLEWWDRKVLMCARKNCPWHETEMKGRHLNPAEKDA